MILAIQTLSGRVAPRKLAIKMGDFSCKERGIAGDGVEQRDQRRNNIQATE